MFSESKRTILDGSCVGNVQCRRVRNQDVLAEESDVCVEVVVGKVHQLGSGDFLVEIGRTLSNAGKARIGRREGSFPHVGKLIKDVGIFGLVCIVVHEDDDALLR